jgi:hypothetical protein
MLVDEAARVSNDLYMAIRPMLAVSGGTLWLMSTPYGKRGFFYEQWAHGGAEWERIRVGVHRKNETASNAGEHVCGGKRVGGPFGAAQS